MKFQSQRRFFGGSNDLLTKIKGVFTDVSIAEAILWGEQHDSEDKETE